VIIAYYLSCKNGKKIFLDLRPYKLHMQRAIIHLHKQGKSQRAIAKEIGYTKNEVLTTINYWKQTRGLDEREGRGRKKKATKVTLRLVRLSL